MQTEERGKRKQEEKKRKRKICTATLTNDNTVKNEARTLSEMWVLWDCVQFQVNYKYTYYNQHCSSSVHHLGLVVAKHYALEFSIKRYLKREERSSLLFETAFAFNAFKFCTFWLFLHVRKRRRKSVMHYSQLEQSSPRQPLSHWQRSGATQRPWTHSLVQRATHT